MEVIEQESEKMLSWYPQRKEIPSSRVTFETKKKPFRASFFRGIRGNRQRCIVYHCECDWPKAFEARLTPYRAKSGTLDVESRFRALADQWKRETRFVSTPNQMFLVPSYQRIIGLGPDAIPLILRELHDEPNHWFWALTALTGDNPVRPEDSGNVRAMRRAWTEWGRERGYL